jgi:hypothetical protein
LTTIFFSRFIENYEDRAPLPEQTGKQERFVLLKRNDPNHPAYYTIRAQNTYTTNRIKAQNTNNEPNNEESEGFSLLRNYENLKTQKVI